MFTNCITERVIKYSHIPQVACLIFVILPCSYPSGSFLVCQSGVNLFLLYKQASLCVNVSQQRNFTVPYLVNYMYILTRCTCSLKFPYTTIEWMQFEKCPTPDNQIAYMCNHTLISIELKF